MKMATDTSYHHLYYSAHADPVEELEKLNQLDSKTQNKSHSFNTDSQLDEKEFKPPPLKSVLKNGNGHSDTRKLLPTNKSITTSSSSPELQANKQLQSQNQIRFFSCCCLTSVLSCILLGFLGGVFFGILVHRHGYGRQLDTIFPLTEESGQGHEIPGNIEDEANDGSFRCTVRLTSQQKSDLMQNCDMCSKTRLLNVSNAWYADCNGLYTLSNLTSVWDKKRTVFERISGGINPQDKRYIYWNSHFYGPDFYGWSIGDSRSLFESGPFHAQGRAGVKDQPWLGSWNGNVTVSMVRCNPGGTEANRIRFGKQKMEELLQKNQLSGKNSNNEE